MGESSSSSLLGSVINVSQDRDGVRIDAPHGWEINDVHHQWTKNETHHYETGNVLHMTSGQVLHANLNLAEVHTTTNVFTMHVDITPLQVHFNQPLVPSLKAHIEPNFLTKTLHISAASHTVYQNHFHQSAGKIEIHSKKFQPTTMVQTILKGLKPASGKMTLEADGEMKLSSKGNIKIASGEDSETRLSLAPTNDNGPGRAKLSSETTFVSARETLYLIGGGSDIEVEKNAISITTGQTTFNFDGAANRITSNATISEFNGRINLGSPSVASNRRPSVSDSGASDQKVSLESNPLSSLLETKFQR